MKKQAARGTWKTPPMLVYAEPGSGPPDGLQGLVQAVPQPSPPVKSNVGTKGLLLGFGPPRPSSSPAPPSPSPSASPRTFGHPALPAEPAAAALPPPSRRGQDTGSRSPPSPIGPSPAASPPAARLPPRSAGRGKAASPAPPASVASTPMSASSAPASAASTPTSAGRAKAAAAAAGKPANKSVELARLRQLAKLRREIQKTTTDQLELEMAELCQAQAYLEACKLSGRIEGAFGKRVSEEVAQAAARNAIDQAVSIVRASANTTRSHDSHYAELEKTSAPDALVPHNDQTDLHLACVVGTRRETVSLVPERRRAAVEWASLQVKESVSDLMQDAFCVAGAVVAMQAGPGALQGELRRVLDLSPSQAFALAKEAGAMSVDVRRILDLERDASVLLSGNLWMQSTEALIEKLRDSMSIEQMAQFLSWTSVDERDFSLP